MPASTRDARTLLTRITDLGATPPTSLSELLAAFDALSGTSTSTTPVADLLHAVVDGKLRGAALDKQIAQAAAAQQAAEFRRGLTPHAERAVMTAFVEALESGAADAVIESVRPVFDAAAQALIECATIVDPHANAEAFLSGTDEKGRSAWQAIKPNIETVTRVAALVTQFGCKSQTFSLIELPVQVGGTAALSDVALLCVDPKYSIEQSSAAFNGTGTHRQSPWFLAASTLRLNDIETARETVRAWAERAWEALGLNRGRGRMEGKTFVPTPIRNPFAKASAT